MLGKQCSRERERERERRSVKWCEFAAGCVYASLHSSVFGIVLSIQQNQVLLLEFKKKVFSILSWLTSPTDTKGQLYYLPHLRPKKELLVKIISISLSFFSS